MIQRLNLNVILLSTLIIGLVILGCFEFTLSIQKLTYSDASYYLFNIIKDKSYFLPHHRYTAVWMEYLPLIGMKLGLTFQSVFHLFGLNSFITSLLILLFYCIQTKDNVGLSILVLSLVYGMAHSYFYYVPEHIHYFIAFFFIFYLKFLVDRQSVFLPIFLIVIVITLAGSHLYSILLFFIGLLYLVISDKKHAVELIYILFFIFIGILLIKLLIPLSGSEKGKLEILKNNLIHIKELDKSAYRYYLDLNFDKITYLYLPITFLAICSFLQKKYYFFFIVLAIYAFLYYLNCLYFFEWDSTAYMNLYGRLSFLSVLMASFFIIKPLKKRIFILVFTIYISLICYAEIKKYYYEYTNRVQYIQELSNIYPNHTKISINTNYVNYQKILLTWATPFESLILSRYQNKCQTLWVNNLKDSNIESLDVDKMFSEFDPIYLDSLKLTYFNFLKKEPYKTIGYKVE